MKANGVCDVEETRTPEGQQDEVENNSDLAALDPEPDSGSGIESVITEPVAAAESWWDRTKRWLNAPAEF